MKPVLILVLGMAGSGKTTLAKKLSDEFKIPLVVKDELKIKIINSLNLKDRKWSEKIGEASYEILFYLAENSFRAGQSIIIESTFNPKFANPQLQKLQKQYKFRSAQVFCYADATIARQRFSRRAISDRSHPSFGEGQEGKENFEYRLKNNLDSPLEIESKIIKVDTTDFSKLDEAEIIRKVRAYLGQE